MDLLFNGTLLFGGPRRTYSSPILLLQVALKHGLSSSQQMLRTAHVARVLGLL